jgi:surfactin synthase thioesterase subunit/MFS family permease
MVPAAFVTLEALPLIPSGKVDRRALPEPEDTRPELETVFVAPRYELEEQIAAIWSEVLSIDTIGIDDNFFDLGGESFKAIRVVRKINESVSVTDLFKYPTVRELAAHLPQEQAKSTGLLHELSRPIPDWKRTVSLVCIPPAGGNAVMYQPLANALPEDCSLYAVELPGHDFSRRDQDLQPLEKVAQMCVEEIERDVPGPIALYAHCIGGALTLEVARLLEESDVELLGVFLGAHLPSPRRLPGKIFEWLDKIFPMRHTRGTERSHLAAARALGGFTDALDPQEQEFVMRNYFHDSFDGLDYYTDVYARSDGQKLRAPILSIMGEMDKATEFYEERYKEWEFFSESVDLAVIPQAGHFFAKYQPHELAEIISGQLPVWQANAAQASRPTADDAALPTQTVAPNLNLFFLVALGQLISILGTGLAAFALDVWVLQQTGSVSAYALVTALTWLPSILLLPIAGAVADRYDRRRIMILSDAVAICATLVIGLLFWTGALQIWHVCAMVIVSSAANAFQRPAYAAAISQMVPKRYLGHVNGLVNVGTAAGNLLSQLGGGVLVMTIGLGGAILVDVLTFLLAVVTLLFVRFPDTLFKKQQEEPLLREVVRGWQYIIKRRGLMAMTTFFLGLNFLSSIVTVLIPPLVLSFGSPATLGAVNTAFGIGLLVGGLVMGLWGGMKRRAEGVVSFVMLFGLFSVLMGLRPSPIYPAIGLLGFGFSIAIVQSHWYTLIQTKVGLYLQGRVIATSNMLATAMMPLGQVLAGPLADKVFEPLMAASGPLSDSVGRLIDVGPGRGIGLLMILIGVIGQVWAILGYRYRPLRFMEDALPDAVPDVLIAADKDELQKQADRQLHSRAV